MFHEIRNQRKPPCSKCTTRGLCLALISAGFCVFSTPSRAPTPTSRGGAPSPRVIASGWLSVCWLVRATASERPETRKKGLYLRGCRPFLFFGGSAPRITSPAIPVRTPATVIHTAFLRDLCIIILIFNQIFILRTCKFFSKGIEIETRNTKNKNSESSQ